jgi:hypothetical protein
VFKKNIAAFLALLQEKPYLIVITSLFLIPEIPSRLMSVGWLED